MSDDVDSLSPWPSMAAQHAVLLDEIRDQTVRADAAIERLRSVLERWHAFVDSVPMDQVDVLDTPEGEALDIAANYAVRELLEQDTGVAVNPEDAK